MLINSEDTHPMRWVHSLSKISLITANFK
jgi:hypothetical protein